MRPATPIAAAVDSWGWVVSLAVLGVAWDGARVLVRDIAERRASEVDEYELAQRHAARDAGYVAALVSALVLYLVLSVAGQLAERGPTTCCCRRTSSCSPPSSRGRQPVVPPGLAAAPSGRPRRLAASGRAAT
ncbi:hypothetical protein [Blastococcus sp. SYSU DS0619]